MNVKIKLFAAAKDIAGSDEVELTVDAEADITSIKSALSAQFPAMQALLSRSRFAVDQQYVADTFVVSQDHEIAFIPPVSGG